MKPSLKLSFGIALAAATFVASPAMAQEDDIVEDDVYVSGPAPAPKPAPASPTPKPPPWMESYAWQTLVADVATIGVATTSFATADPRSGSAKASYTIGLGAAGAWFFASPTIHAFHGRWEAAAGSLALRVVGVPTFALGGAILGTVLCPAGKSGDWGCLSSAVYGFGLGAITGIISASAVDAIFLAREPVEIDKPNVDRPKATGRPKPYEPVVRFAPSVDPWNRTATVGVGGTW